MKLLKWLVLWVLGLNIISYGAVDCRGEARWQSGNYRYSSDTQYVIHKQILWGHIYSVSAEPGTTSLWVRKDSCQDPMAGFKFDTVLAQTSSQQLSSSSNSGPLENEVNWKGEKFQSLRCDLSGRVKDPVNRSCIDPDALKNAVLKVPRNVTRVSKDMFTLCNIRKGEKTPTVIAYVLDRSTSMDRRYQQNGIVYEPSDPDSIADDAIAAGMQKQALLNPSSYAGYLSFNQGLRDSVPPLRLNLDSNLKVLQSTVLHAKFNYYTWYLNPMNTAIQWMAAPQFKGYRKAIVFVSDGGPNDLIGGKAGSESQIRDSVVKLMRSAKAAGNGIDFHGIYLNADVNHLGQDVLKAMADSTGGTFTSLVHASDMSGVIENIVQNTLVENTPIGMQVENEQTKQYISASNEDLHQQADSAWQVGLNTNLSLVQGLNAMSFKTLYRTSRGDTTSTSIHFSIEVLEDALNQELSLSPTPFATVCYEPNKLRIYADRDSTILTLRHQNRRVWVNLSTVEHKGFGDSVPVLLYAQSGDSLKIVLPKISVDSGVNYGTWVDLGWQKKPVHDLEVELQPSDLLYGEWHHPTDAQDASFAKLPALWEMSRPTTVELWDQNHDGRLDSMVFKGGIGAQDWMLEHYQLMGKFWSDSSTVEQELSWTHYGQFGVGADSLLYWKAQGSPLGVSTGLPNQGWKLRLFGVTQQMDTINLKLLDRMNPVLTRARIVYKDKAGQNADLSLRFSENLRRDSLITHPAFDFVLKGKKQENAHYSLGRWMGSNEYRIPFVVDGAEFSVFPDDSVQAKVGVGYIQDSAGLYAYEDASMVPVDGDLPLRIQVKSLVQVQDEVQGPLFEIGDLGLGQSAEDWVDQSQKFAVAIGPFKVAKDSSQSVFSWNVAIYDGMGQFLVDQSGQVDCRSTQYAEACKSKQGIYQGVQWNHCDEKGRQAGSGAYVVRIRVGHVERFYHVGISRLN